MADLIDKSLDDIIKMKKKTVTKRTSNQGAKPKPNTQRLKKLGVRSGIIKKGGPRQVPQRQTPNASPKKELTLLHVSNLHYNVSNDDVRELFSEIGPIKKAVVHYDKSGRSLGTAEVTFTTRDAAIRAIKKYNNLPLDGRPMQIKIVPNEVNIQRSPAKSRIGVKPGSGVQKRQQNNGRPQNNNQKNGRANKPGGGKPKFQKGQRQAKKPVTAEDLDADLEAYTMNVD